MAEIPRQYRREETVEGKPRPSETHPASERIDPCICPQHCPSDQSWYGVPYIARPGIIKQIKQFLQIERVLQWLKR